MRTLRSFIESLCSDQCAGRAPGSPGGRAARSLIELTTALERLTPMATAARTAAEKLLGRCDKAGRLSEAERPALQQLVGRLESSLS